MEDKEVIEKIKEWLENDIASEDIPSAVRINSQALLEYINNWQKG
tara:strand:- start:315 stop:449 length:135 start_codon:yes stop_codon:yes gene_type:complete